MALFVNVSIAEGVNQTHVGTSKYNPGSVSSYILCLCYINNLIGGYSAGVRPHLKICNIFFFICQLKKKLLLLVRIRQLLGSPLDPRLGQNSGPTTIKV
jgi:hypothetical protein